MTLDLAYLEDFQALVTTGNFSRAAALRAMTQPAFSRRIRALEAWAGTALFERETQPITLTAPGRAVQPALADALRLLHQARDAARDAAAHHSGTLRFAATHVLSFAFFPRWLLGLEAGQPLEAVQLVSDTLHACEQSIRQGQVQFLLCHRHAAAPLRLDPQRFVARRVGQDMLVPVVAPGPDGQPRHTLTPGGTAPYLAYSALSGLGRIAAAARPAGLEPMRLDTVFTSHLAAALRTMALSRRGIAWLPQSLVADDLATGRLVRAGAAALDIAVDIQLVRPASRLSAAAERFWAGVQAPSLQAPGDGC